jgi:alanine-glyoxylate transaminase/serine-glyoxylate transaminase/serine-pyruvate transaminase
MVAGLEAGLDRILAEGLDAVWARHEAAGAALRDGLEAMGLELFAADGHRLPSLTTVKVPDGVNSTRVRAHLLERFDIEIGAGVRAYRDKIWRIGLMGPNASPASVTLVLGALEETLAAVG